MFSFGKSKRVVNIVIDNYVIRMIENNGKDISSINISAEKMLPEQTIQNGKIIDELKFFDFMKELVEDWNLKGRNVRFNVPHELIILREIELPRQVRRDELKQYITLETGNTIHFPFKNPVFDIYDAPDEDTVEKVTVLAAPEEEIMKYTEIFHDAKLEPVAVDAQPLGTYRYFLTEENAEPNDVYLFLELDLTSANISIFHNHTLEFLRYQSFNVVIEDWQPNTETTPIEWTFTGDETNLYMEVDDQLNEIDSIMNFYRFSIHQGDKSVTNIVLLGDYPNLDDIRMRVENRYDVPVTVLTTEDIGSDFHTVFIPAIGLALKGAL